MATGLGPTGPVARRVPGMRGLVIALIVAAGAFAASLILRTPGAYLPWADVWLYNGTIALAAVLAALRARSGGPLTRPWYLVAAALVTDALGGLAYAAESAGAIPATPVPVSDLLWLAYYPLAFVGLLLLARRRLSLTDGYPWLDALVVGTGSFAVLLALVSRVVQPTAAGSGLSDAVNSLYLVGDLILIVLILSVVQAFGGRQPDAWWLLMGGYLCVVAADTAYLVEVHTSTYIEGSWLDVLWPVSAALVGLAAWRDRAAARAPVHRRRLALVGPSIAVIAAAVVLLVYEGGFLRWMVVGAALATIVLAVVRLNLDARQSRRLTQQLLRSHVDPLTGLMNRRGLLDTRVRSTDPCALILIDLDAFKDVNDSLGHAAGDRLLVEIAERLRHNVREGDLLARLGGDEFGLLLWNADAEGASVAAEGLIRDIEVPLSLEGVPVVMTACAGVSDTLGTAHDVAALLQEADAALYAAKSDGPGLVRAQAGAPGDQSQERLRIRAEARAALDAGGSEFVVFYQPIVGIADGQALCAESLVRWQHDGRLLEPAAFLGEIVRGGEMAELTRHMLRTSLREVAEHHVDLPVTVNVPPELITQWLLDETESALADLALPPERLIVEITEEAIMKDPGGVAEVLRTLRTRGVRILLDDFGTGWSGLSSLRDLIVDGIKVDHSFVSRLTTDPTAASIVRGISQVASDLDLLVIYEGAESAEVMSALAGYPGGYVQGFARARPMPVADLTRWLIIQRTIDVTTR